MFFDITMNSLSVSLIHYEPIIVLAYSLWIYQLLHEFTMNSLWFHYLFLLLRGFILNGLEPCAFLLSLKIFDFRFWKLIKNATNKMDSPMTKSGQDGIWGPKLKLKHVRFGLLVRIMKFRRISTVHLRNNHDQFSWTVSPRIS